LKYSRIKELSRVKKLRIEDLAAKIGMTAPGFHKMIKNETITVETLEKISKVLGVSMAYWFDDELKGLAKEDREAYANSYKVKVTDLERQVKILDDLVATKEILIQRLLKEVNHPVKT
jgi:transcriptional regulator with XRE-family HTH domain